MTDFVFLGLTLLFFAVCVAYVSLCDRIVGADAAQPAPSAGGAPSGGAADGSTATDRNVTR